MPRVLFAGVMSGTSLDGVDAVIAQFAQAPRAKCATLGSAHLPFARDLRSELMALQSSGPDELVRAARAANALADCYADAICAACESAGVAMQDLVAVGVHGQTVRHRPHEGWTLQLNNGARVAERTGVDIVTDFRSRDIAAGGQGAPLVPAFHAAIFGGTARHRVIDNIGGIANITDLPVSGPVRGFDTGPGNVLLDLWCTRHQDATYDDNGAWAATGRVDSALLDALLREPYFALPPPKSTGRDLFAADWLDTTLLRTSWRGAAADAQATLSALTARTIADAVRAHARNADEILVCGGGANNATLMRQLTLELAPRSVVTTAVAGVATDHVEALAFAWLAREAIAGRPGNLPAVTGAAGLRVLGAIYPR